MINRRTFLQLAVIPAWDFPVRMPLPRGGYAAGVVGKNLVVAGGSYWISGWNKVRTTQCHIYDPVPRVWDIGPSLPLAVCDCASAVVGERLLVIGGQREGEITGEVLQFDVANWKPASVADRLSATAWQPQAPLPEPRALAAAATAGESVYLFGGITRGNEYGSATAGTLRFEGGKWTAGTPLPGGPRFTHAAVTWQNKIYVFGGASQQGSEIRNYDEVWAYDIGSASWQAAGKLPQPTRALWAAAGPDGIYIFGGYSTRFHDEVLRYDPASQTFTPAGKLPSPIADCKFFYRDPWWIGAGGEPAEKERSDHTWQTLL